MPHYGIEAHILQDGATTATNGSTFQMRRKEATFQAVGSTGSGAGAAVINIEFSNDGTNWITGGTISLTLSTTAVDDGFASDAAWKYVRSDVDSISGTGASVTVTMGYER